ncbi:MAG: hypothetical protein KH230_22810 [Enterocloster asparagiformis]|nr:hypothetical protein [Enterocloster asparagiformis]
MITVEFKNFDDMVTFARNLVRDLAGKAGSAEQPQPVQQSPTPPAQPQPVQQPSTPPVQPQPVQQPPMQPQPVQQPPMQPQPVQQPPMQPQPVQQPPTQPPVQTSTPSYTADELSRAAITLMDAGRQNELIGLLQQFGVMSVPNLRPDQYGAFATALRGLGAQI